VRVVAPGEVSARWNHWNLYREIAWYGVLSGVTTTFTSIFALRLGASNFLMGLLTSLPALANVLFQMPAARLVEREPDRRRVLLLSGFLMRVPALLIALVPALSRSVQASAVVAITALGTIPAALGNVSFTAMLADVVAPHHRARVVSVRNALLSAATMSVVLVAGEVLDVAVFPLGYQAIFALAFLGSLVSLYYLGRVAIPDNRVEAQPAPKELRPGLRQSLRMVRAQSSFARFLLGSFLYHWGLHFPIPLYAIYRVRVLHISEGGIGTLAMVESAVTIAAYYFWGRVAHRRGSRSVLLMGLLLVCFYPFLTALSRSVSPLLFAAVVAGIAAPAFNLGLFNNMLEVAPAERRATYVALFNTAMNVAAFVSPLLGTAAAEAFGIRQALFMGGAARFLGFLGFAYVVAGLRIPKSAVRAVRN
jgi:MFS family permease